VPPRDQLEIPSVAAALAEMFYSIVLALLAGSPAVGLDINANTNLAELPINSLFTKWRPTYHFIAPRGWLNVRSFFASNCARRLLILLSTGPLWSNV